MRPFRLSRRTLLRGAGGAAIALPWLECMTAPRKAYAAGPQRLVIWFSPNGTIYENWKPTGGETNFTLSPILSPLEKWKSKLTIIDGLHQGANGTIGGPGDDHMKGMAWMLTGRILNSGTIPGGGGAPPAGLATGLSIDQHIANSIGMSTKFKSLEFGVHSLTVAGNPLFHMVYSGANAAIQPQQNPSQMFDRVFGTFTAPSTGGTPTVDPAAARLQKDQSSVIDAVLESYTTLQPKLGVADKEKVDQHVARLRELEVRIKNAAGSQMPGTTLSSKCAKPTKPANNDAYSEANYQTNGTAQMDLLTMALTCDLARVASLQWSYSSGGPTMTWLQQTRGHHDFSHDGDSNADSKAQLTRIDTWYAQQFSSLLDRMAAIQEGDGTMLDNSLVVWVNELAKGNVHSHDKMCYVLAGAAGGKLKTGRYLPMKDHHNNLLVSLMNAMGVAGNTFGDPSACTGPLKGLL